MGVAARGAWALDAEGEAGRTGGVPCRGGEVPTEFDRAAARADTPGPGRLCPGPGNGDKLPGLSPLPRLGDPARAKGGVPSRFVASALDSEVPKERGPREDAGDEDSNPKGAPCCEEDALLSLPDVDMMIQALISTPTPLGTVDG